MSEATGIVQAAKADKKTTKQIVNVALIIGGIVLLIAIARFVANSLNTSGAFVNVPEGDLTQSDQPRLNSLAFEIRSKMPETYFFPEIFGASPKDALLLKMLQLNNGELAVLNNIYNANYSDEGTLYQVIDGTSSYTVTTRYRDQVLQRLQSIGAQN